MNSVMTAGLHHRWRERAADLASVGPGDSALDLCCGTGDLAFELKPPGRPRGRGRRPRLLRADAGAGAGQVGQEAGAPVSFVHGNALDLPFNDG